MAQHRGDKIVAGHEEIHGQVTGTTYVRAGAFLEAFGQLAGGLIIEEGGRAIIRGQVSRNVLNYGSMTLFGQVCGRIVGNRPTNQLTKNQEIGTDLEVPFRGTTISWEG